MLLLSGRARRTNADASATGTVVHEQALVVRSSSSSSSSIGQSAAGTFTTLLSLSFGGRASSRWNSHCRLQELSLSNTRAAAAASTSPTAVSQRATARSPWTSMCSFTASCMRWIAGTIHHQALRSLVTKEGFPPGIGIFLGSLAAIAVAAAIFVDHGEALFCCLVASCLLLYGCTFATQKEKSDDLICRGGSISNQQSSEIAPAAGLDRGHGTALDL